MQNRTKLALGFLASATLLSGSAFAEAPSFDSPLPTVIITDRFETDLTTASMPYFDPVPALTTQYIFRYTDAFAPLDYIALGDASAASMRFLFSEFDDASDLTPNSASTLTINNSSASSMIPSAAADFASAPFLSASPVGDPGSFDFRNIDFSPGLFTDGEDAGTSIGVVTGDNITLGPQSRVVSLFIHSDDLPDEIDSASMLVVTRMAGAGEGDELSDPAFADPFTCVYSPADLGGWTFAALGVLATVPFTGTTFGVVPGGNAAAFTPSPSVANGGMSPAATATLGVTSTVAATGFGSWSNDGVVPMTAESIYRARVEILSSNPATQAEWRLRFGNIGTGLGDSDSGHFGKNPADTPGLQTTATSFYGYLQPKVTGNAGIFIDLLDALQAPSQFVGTGSDEWTVSGVEVCEATRASLGSGTVVVNWGGTPGSVAGGQSTSPAASPTAFNPATNMSAMLSFNSSRTETFTTTGTARGLTFGPAPGTFTPDFFRMSAANGFAVDENTLYAVDVWVSTSNPAAASLPDLRVEIAMTDSLNPTAAETNQKAQYRQGLTPAANGAAGAAAAAKVYTLWFEPQLGGNAPGEAFLNLAFLELTPTAGNAPGGTTLTVHQITVTGYDLD